MNRFAVALLVILACRAHALTLSEELRLPEAQHELDVLSHSIETYNKIDLLHPSAMALEARYKLISQAKNYIFVTVPFWYADKTGTALLDSIVAKSVEPGFEYRVIQDWVSPWYSPGGHRIANDLGPHLVLWNSPRWQRNFSYNLFSDHIHDKFFIVDGDKMIVGSTNINDEHLLGGIDQKGWHDTDILVEGPAARIGASIFIKIWQLCKYMASDLSFPPWKKEEVQALQNYFYKNQEDHDFYTATNTPPFRENHHVHIELKSYLENPRYIPPVMRSADFKTPMRLIYDNHLIDRDPVTLKHYSNIRRTILYLLAHTKKSAHFYIPYPSFDKEFFDLLTAAAKRIDITIVTNSEKTYDMGIDGYRGDLSHYEGLVEAGVHLYEWLGNEPLLKEKEEGCVVPDKAWPGHTLHTKIAFFDGEVVMLGSNNMDKLSFEGNNEEMTLINDADMAAKIQGIFDHDLHPDSSDVTPISCEGKKVPRIFVEKMTLPRIRELKKIFKVKGHIWKYPMGR